MTKHCKLVYLDKNGNESAVYKDALDRYGQEEAERVYLRYMQGLASIKYSLNPDNITNWDTFLEQSRSINAATNDNPYYTRGANKYERTSTILNEMHKPFQVRKVAEDSVIRKLTNKLLRSNPSLNKDQAAKEINKVYNIQDTEEGKVGNDEFNNLVAEVEAEFEFKREAGTEIHNTLEDFVNLRNFHKDDPEWDVNRLAEQAVSGIPDSNVQEDQIKLIKRVNKVLKNIGIPGDLDKFQFETEVPVWDDEMGIGGTIDLLIRDDKGTLHVFDYKTKEKGKEQFWDSTVYGYLDIPGMQIHDNKESMASLQTSLYKEILMRKGFKVSQPKVIYVEAKVQKKNPTLSKADSSNLMYTNFSKPKIKPLRDLRNAWVRVLKNRTNADGITKNIDLDAPWRYEYEEGKLNNVQEMVEEFAGGDPLSSNIDYTRRANSILETGVIKNLRTGKDSFIGPTNSRIDFKEESESARKAQIIEVFRDHYTKKENTVNAAFNFFNESTSRLSELQKYQLDYALSGISKETHDLQQMNSVRGMYDIDANVLLATDKRTGVAQIIIIENEHERKVKFDRSNSSTILGNYFRDNYVEREYGTNRDILKSTTGNFKIMSAALAAMKLKSLQPDLKLEKVRYAPVLDASTKDQTRPPRTLDMLALVPQATALLDQIKDSEGGLSSSLQRIYDSPDVKNALSYNEDYLTTLYDLLNEGKGSIKSADGYRRAIEDYRNGDRKRNELINSLLQYQGTIEKEAGNAVSRADLAKNEAYVLASKAILNLANIEFYLGRNPEKFIADKNWRSYSRIKHSMISAGDQKRAIAEHQAVAEFMDFRKQHTALLDAFIKENDTTLLGPKLKRNYSKVFKVLMIDPNDKVYSLDSMKLKTAQQLRDERRPAAAKYVEFFNKSILNGFEKTMSKKEFETFNWTEGNIPITRQSFNSQMSSADNPKEYLRLLKDRFINGGKKQTNSLEEIKYFLDDQYATQASETQRLKKLGLDDEGEVIDADVAVEMNLEAVLDNFMIDSVRRKHMNQVLGYFRAMNNVLAAAELTDRLDTTESRLFLDKMVQSQIHGEVDDEGAFGQWTDILNNLSTYTQLAFSPKQMVVEMTTNLMSSLNTNITQQLKGLFGGRKRFSTSQWAQAGGMLAGSVFEPKIAPILEQLGMIHADIDNLYDSSLKETLGNNIFQSKYAFWINSKALTEFKNQVFLAEALNDGIIDAYEYNKDNDTAIYNERKDKRFFNADGSQTQDQLAFYEAVKKVMAEEGSLNEDGTLSRPYSFAEMQDKREYYKDVFGSMGKEAKNNAMTGAFARLITKFKHWAQAKKDLYYSPRGKSDSRFEWVKVTDPENPENYYYHLQNAYNEGILQTIMAMRDNCLAMMGRSGYKKQDLTDIQRENLAKLTTDMVFTTIMIYAITGLLDDEKFFNTEAGKLVEAGLIMGLKDSQMWFITQDLSKSSMMAAPGMLVNNASRLMDAMMMASTGDFGPAAEKALGITAITRAGLAGYKYVAEDE